MADKSAGHGERKIQVFELLEEESPRTVGELADECGVSESTIRGILSREMDRDFIENEGGEFTPGVGRAKGQYVLTEKGSQELERLRELDSA